ncbi:MAG: hypothetical protein ACJ74Z_22075 [Bryobacteraceae bacterium]
MSWTPNWRLTFPSAIEERIREGMEPGKRGAKRALARLTTFNIPLLTNVHLDLGALVFTLLLAVVTGVVFGPVPVLQVPKLAVSNALNASIAVPPTRASTPGFAARW